MRVGVVGLRQGLHLGVWAARLGFKVVAVCDHDPALHGTAQQQLPDATVTDRWQDLLDADLDGVVLANDFDAHAPLAIAFLERGIHVLSETAACADVEQGRRLIAAADASSATYSFAENYVFHPQVRLIRQAVDAGELGRPQLIEADYLHGLSREQVDGLIGDPAHWRGRIAATAYCTHTVSPVLALTGGRPVEVTAFAVDADDPRAAVTIVVRLSTGALAITRHGFLQGEPDSHWSWLSVRGSHALAESLRAAGDSAWSVRVRREAWTRQDGAPHEEVRTPSALTRDGRPVDRGAEGTVLLLEGFRDTAERGEPPLVPVRAAVEASLVGVAGAESLRSGSRPVAMPDLSGS
ncbi:oxidoreductase domain protein [Kribbella flavida DSM 17836]|uniref:Oxidoreductase domain protein n=1 Tax=Kribbella flavida (strain DSM 17836 / JCM 10339 / NBRC 14399) TaxID=479435 RepID=D2PRA4_KRIFD|nr:Gfo/Idh/MocA family oxidoreductase [Kribbella flavida]ADB33052.1 oxidoreductase domain protein [Kribbella flavida DSM 17836]